MKTSIRLGPALLATLLGTLGATLVAVATARAEEVPASTSLFGMRGYPPTAPGTKDPTQRDAAFFPCIDAFGQYIHKDWPGKIHGLEDVAAHREVAAELYGR